MRESQLERHGYIQLKRWVTEEAIRTGKGLHAIYARVSRGYYSGTLKVVQVNCRVSFVKPMAERPEVRK